MRDRGQRGRIETERDGRGGCEGFCGRAFPRARALSVSLTEDGASVDANASQPGSRPKGIKWNRIPPNWL